VKSHASTLSRHGHPYRRLALMVFLSFLAMYALMYAMVDGWSNVYGSFNQAYMAGLMTAPMLLIELALMGNDPALQQLCKEIIDSQQREIAQMKASLADGHAPAR
jgi:hypothetical protein